MSQEKPWLDSYPEGVPHVIDASQYVSLSHMLEDAFSQYAHRAAFDCMGRQLSFKELDQASQQFAAYLQSLGLSQGARVALMMPNVLQYPIALAGTLRAGYVVVNVNPLYTPRELAYQLKDSGATAIVVLENFAATLQEVMGHSAIQHVVLASIGDLLGPWYGRWMTFAVRHLAKLVPEFELPLDGGRTVTSFKKAISQGRQLSLKAVPQTLDDIAFLQYTGGTTGLSKGAVLTHRNIVAAILQAEGWFAPALTSVGDLRKVNSIAALPLYHIFGFNTNMMLSLRMGGCNILIANPRDLTKIFTTPEYAAWRSLRESDDARYLAMCMPRFLARLPYGAKTNPVDEFAFEEDTEGASSDKYCWVI